MLRVTVAPVPQLEQLKLKLKLRGNILRDSLNSGGDFSGQKQVQRGLL